MFQKINPFFGLLVLSFALSACASASVIYDVKKGRAPISELEFRERLTGTEQLIIGEKHNVAEVQAVEAKLIDDFFTPVRPSITLAWEFLNWSDRARNNALFTDYTGGKITDREFLNTVFGAGTPQLTYAPILKVAKTRAAELLSVNLSRSEKAPVVNGGLSALDPTLLPPGFKMGGEGYFSRFKNAMSGHEGDPRHIRNYFEAQCLVDDVLAFHLTNDASHRPNALIVGDFHVKYFDGAMKRLAERDPNRRRILVLVSDASDFSSVAEMKNSLVDRLYGPVADFVWFVGQPKSHSAW